MLIQEISFEKGKEECLGTSLGKMLALSSLYSQAQINKYITLGSGDDPGRPKTKNGDNLIVDIRDAPFYGPRRSG